MSTPDAVSHAGINSVITVAILLGGAFVVYKLATGARKAYVAKPSVANSGVVGASVVTDPTAPKTTGDFARYDRTRSPLVDVPPVTSSLSLVDTLQDGAHAA